jgi:hypothetical protein
MTSNGKQVPVGSPDFTYSSSAMLAEVWNGAADFVRQRPQAEKVMMMTDAGVFRG